MPKTIAVVSVTSGSAVSGQDRERPEDRCHQWGEPGLDGVHEPQPAADEAAGEQVAGEPGAKGDEELVHMWCSGESDADSRSSTEHRDGKIHQLATLSLAHVNSRGGGQRC